MISYQKIIGLCGLTLVCNALTSLPAAADSVWHCSRSDVQIADVSDDFTLASLTSDREVIRLSLRDLYNVYQGTLVRMSGNLPLSACILDVEKSLTRSALASIGAKPTHIAALAKSNNLSARNMYLVADEASMLACISKRHPAIGYLPKVTNTETVGPCF